MPVSPAILHRLGQLSRTPAALAFSRAARDPERAQRAVLRRLMAAHATTEYGRLYGFGDISTAREYAERVPLMTPDALQPWVQRTMDGERDVICAGNPLAYVMTTGSTGPAKYVPITAAYKAEFQRTIAVSMWHLYRRFPEAFRGRVLYFVGARRAAVANDGRDIGTMSGFNFTELPAVIRALYAWPAELFEVADLRARTFLSLYFALVGDVSLIAGVFPAPIVFMLRALAEQADELAFHIERGTLPPDLALTSAQRARFAASISARPDVAARLRGVTADDAVARALPRLRLVYCWMTSTAALFVPELRRRLGPQVALRDAIYSASEGWCSIPMGDEQTGGALAITSHFFEFIEESTFERGRRDTLGAAELSDGGRYYIVVSNSGGVWRYVLGDLVEVCGFFADRTPRIRFVRKHGAACNLVGELLEEPHVDRALATALARSGASWTWCALVPRTASDMPAYDLLVEPAGAHDLPATLAAEVDEALAAEAQRWGVLRRAGTLGPIRLVPIPRGRFEAWRQRQVAAGAGEAQLKTAHLIADAARLPAELRAP